MRGEGFGTQPSLAAPAFSKEIKRFAENVSDVSERLGTEQNAKTHKKVGEIWVERSRSGPPDPEKEKAAPAVSRDGKQPNENERFNFYSTEIEPRASISDGVLIACDGVAELAQTLVLQSVALLSAASAGDIAATEARLWALRRALKEAVATWREAVSSLEIVGRAA